MDGIIHKPEQAYYNMGDNKSHLCGFRALIIGETVGRWTSEPGPLLQAMRWKER